MFPEWVARYFRNQWLDVSGMGSRMLRNAHYTRKIVYNTHLEGIDKVSIRRV